MKKKHILLIMPAIPLLTGLLLVVGFKLQQVFPVFRGLRTQSDGGYTECRYYLALRPSHLKAKVGGGLFSEVFHGDAVFYWPNGALRGKWRYVDGVRDGTVTTWHEDGRLRATWTARKEQAVPGSLKVYTEEARNHFVQQGAEKRHGPLAVTDPPDTSEEKSNPQAPTDVMPQLRGEWLRQRLGFHPGPSTI